MHLERFNIGDRVVLIKAFYGKVGDEGYVFGYSCGGSNTPFIVFDRPQGHTGKNVLDRPNPEGLRGWFVSRIFMEVTHSLSLITEPDADDII